MDSRQVTVVNANSSSPVGPIENVAPRYKRTEVGVIPEDWNLVDFGDLVNYVKGYAFKSSEYVDDGVRVIRVSDTTYDSINDDDAVFVSESSANSYTKWCLRENDLIFSTVGSKPPMYDSLVGKVILVPREYAGSLLNQNAVFVRTKKYSDSFQKLLLNHFRTDRYVHYIEIIYRGNANQASITLADLFNYKLPLPSTKAEKEAIAEALSNVDGLLTALEALIAKKRAIKQAAMQQLLTGKTRLPGFSGAWETKRLGEIADVDPENLPSGTKPDYPFNYISLEQVDAGWLLGYSEEIFRTAPSRARRVLRNGDVLMSTVRPNLMAHLLFREQVPNAVSSTGFAVLRAKSNLSNPGFLFSHLFGHVVNEQINKTIAGSNYPAINSGDVKALEIPCPPEVYEQTAIATVFSDMDAEIAALERRRDKTRAIKKGMMQQLLTGRVRLVNPVRSETTTC